MAQRVKATFPIGYGLKAPEDADKVGGHWEDRRKVIHATNFIIDSDKKVTQACYATGPIGRIVAEDALRSVQAAKKRKSAARLKTRAKHFSHYFHCPFAISTAHITVRDQTHARRIDGAAEDAAFPCPIHQRRRRQSSLTQVKHDDIGLDLCRIYLHARDLRQATRQNLCIFVI